MQQGFHHYFVKPTSTKMDIQKFDSSTMLASPNKDEVDQASEEKRLKQQHAASQRKYYLSKGKESKKRAAAKRKIHKVLTTRSASARKEKEVFMAGVHQIWDQSFDLNVLVIGEATKHRLAIVDKAESMIIAAIQEFKNTKSIAALKSAPKTVKLCFGVAAKENL